MKICIIAPIVIPIRYDIAYGGIESIVSLATEEFVKMGHKVKLFASGDSITHADLIPIVKSAIGIGRSIQEEQEINRRAFELAVIEKPDLIWDHTMSLHAQQIIYDKVGVTYNPKISLIPSKQVNTNEIPIIHTIHGSIHDPFGNLVPKLIQKHHYFIAISSNQYNSFKKVLGTSLIGKVFNAVNTDKFIPGKEKKPYLLWVGRYTMEKGAQIALLAAHAAGKSIKMLGKLNEPHEYAYFTTFIQPNLGQADALYSNINIEEKIKLFQEAEATIMPVLWDEPFGLVSIESMSSGTPVIASNKGSLYEILGEYGTLVKTDDLNLNFTNTSISPDHIKLVKRFAKAMKNIESTSGQKLHKWVEDSFSAHSMAESYISYFNKVLEEYSSKTTIQKNKILRLG